MANDLTLREALAGDPDIGALVDLSLSPPMPFRGNGPIRLIILGQDPTVKRRKSREAVVKVLNLDRPGSLRRYLESICAALGLSVDAHVYATNYVNVFFKAPPASLTGRDILGIAGKHCLPYLLDELGLFPGLPILSLGEPVLRQIVSGSASSKVHEYWGYHRGWQQGETTSLAHLPARQNTLDREVFPFPHQPSANKPFYKGRLADYLAFMKSTCFG